MRSEAKTHEEIARKLEELGWRRCLECKGYEVIHPPILRDTLWESLRRLNSRSFSAEGLSGDDEEEVLKEVYRMLLNFDEVEVLDMLKNGVLVSLFEGRRGTKAVNVKLIDFENVERNEFCFVHEAEFEGRPRNSRPDFTLFVNGIPIVIIEAKREIAETETYKKGLGDIEEYEKNSPELFKFVQIGVVIADKNVYIPVYPNKWRESRSSRREYVWRDDEGIWEILKPKVLLDIIQNFIFFTETAGSRSKIVPRYMQYEAVSKIFERVEGYLEGRSKRNRGLVWHWQGTGKTYEIIFLIEKFFRRFGDKNPCAFVVVDRIELEEQFDERVMAPLRNAIFKPYYKKIESIGELKGVLLKIRKMEENPRISVKGVWLVTAHKFSRDVAETFDMVGRIRKKEILILRDEAHRTEGGILASVRKYVMPDAVMIGFTGTPVHRKERNTFRDYAYPPDEYYLHRYFIEDSIRDGFTVPLLWRVALAEGVGIRLDERQIRELIRKYFVEREDEIDDVDEIEVEKKEIEKALPFTSLLMSKEFIKKASEYIARNLKEDTENFRFKALVVAQSRESAVLFKRYLDKFLPKYVKGYDENWVKVVITHGADDNDVIKLYKDEEEGKEDVPIEKLHRRWAEDFIYKGFPKVLVVNRKLLTGFDAPNLKVIYIAQVMKDILLLQACARANRPYAGKKYGLVVDLCGFLVDNFRRALEDYTIYEDKDRAIQEDMLKNLFIESEKLWAEFEKKLDEFEELFRKVTGLKWNKFVEILRKGSSKEVKQTFNEVVAKIVSSYDGVYRLYPVLRELIKIYDSIGSFPDKVSRNETYKDLRVLSAWIGRKLNPRERIPDDLKKELISRGLEFGEIEDIGKLKVKFEDLKSVGKDYFVVADILLPLIAFVESKRMVIYRALYERLNELRAKYLEGKIKTKELLDELEHAIDEVEHYEKIFRRQRKEDLLVRVIEVHLGKVGLKLIRDEKRFEKIREILREMMKGRIITEDMKSNLKIQLLWDVSMEGVDLEEVERRIDEVVDTIVLPLIEEIKKEGKDGKERG